MPESAADAKLTTTPARPIYQGSIHPTVTERISPLRPAGVLVRVKKFAGYFFASLLIGAVIIAGIGGWTHSKAVEYAGGVIMVLMILRGGYHSIRAKRGDCPYCGGTVGNDHDTDLFNDDERDKNQCKHCSGWLISHQGALRAFTRSDITDETKFPCFLVPKGAWPDECVVCGLPPTRRVAIKKTTVDAAKLLTGTLRVQSGSVNNVPCCDAHQDAVELDVDDDRLVLVFPDYDAMARYHHFNLERSRQTGASRSATG